MKHLTTLLTALVAFAAAAQQMPYNPDANGDDFVGVDDVLGVLGVYDTALMQPDLQCDYEGTDLEQLFIGLADGALILDSVYVEYLLLDTHSYYTPGCPDIIVEPLVLERGYTCSSTGVQYYESSGATVITASSSHFNYTRTVEFSYQNLTNTFCHRINDWEVNTLPSFGTDSNWASDFPSCSCGTSLPFPEGWGLTEDGIIVQWCPWKWVYQTEYFRLIPFWHEAE